MWFIIGLVLLYFYSRAGAANASALALSKSQASVQTAPCCSISTTCKCYGPIQHRTPQVLAPTNVPIPTGMITFDDGRNIGIATANATLLMLIDGLRNVIAETTVDEGQNVTFNYAVIRARSNPCCGCGLACGSIDTFVAQVVLQGPGGSTVLRNPFYTTASSCQQNGKLNLCSGQSPVLQEPGIAFQDGCITPAPIQSTPCAPTFPKYAAGVKLGCGGSCCASSRAVCAPGYTGPAQLVAVPVCKGSTLNLPSASTIVSPGNAACTQHS